MKLKSLSVMTVLFVFVFTFSLPAFAKIEHNATYKLDGKIRMERHVGLKEINTSQKIKIEGEGSLERDSNVSIKKGELRVEEENKFSSLAITSIIKFDTPSEAVYSNTKHISSYKTASVRKITEQIWLIQVETKSGELGELSQDFIARNYPKYCFEIEQVVAITEGKVKRYIDVRSPYDNEYLYENFSIIGSAKIEETFKLRGLLGWCKLF